MFFSLSLSLAPHLYFLFCFLSSPSSSLFKHSIMLWFLIWSSFLAYLKNGKTARDIAVQNGKTAVVALLDAHVKVPNPFRNYNNSTPLSIRPHFRRPVLSEGTCCGRARASGSATHMLPPGLHLCLIICAFKIYIRRMLQMRRLQLMPRLPRFESPLNNNISILHRPLPHHHHHHQAADEKAAAEAKAAEV